MDQKSKKTEKFSTFSLRVLKVVAIIIPVVLLLFLVAYVFKVLLFVLAAILIASFFRKIAGWIRYFISAPMPAALGLAILMVVILVITVNWLLAPQVIKQANNLIDQLPSAIENTRQYLESHWWGQQLISQLPEDPQQFLKTHSGWALQTFGVLSSTFGILADVYIVALIGLFIMFNPAPYVNGLVALVPVSAQQRAREVIREVYTILQRWLMGKLLSMLVVSVLTAIGLFILGMPLVLFLSILAGTFAFIPNFGPILALIPAVLVAIMQGPSMVLYVIGLYILVQAIESNLITPFIQREMVYLPLAMIVIAQVVLGILIGGLGLVFATPIMAVVIVLIRMLYIQDVLGQQDGAEVTNASNQVSA